MDDRSRPTSTEGGTDAHTAAASGAVPSRRLRQLLAADAVWDALLGVALCLSPLADRVGMSAARPWPLFVVLGLGCLGFAVALALAATGTNSLPVGRAAALGNAAAVVAAVVVLLVPQVPTEWGLIFALIAIGCGIFAVLEWRALRTTAS